MVNTGHIRRQVAVDPPSAVLQIGAPYQAIDVGFRLLEEPVEQKRPQETGRAGEEYVGSLRWRSSRWRLRADGRIENRLSVQRTDRTGEPVRWAGVLPLGR